MACWATTATIIGTAPFPGDLASVGLAAFGALLPDIDHPGSMLGRRLRLISEPMSAMFGHRGMTHSLAGIAVVLAALYFWDPAGLAGRFIWPLAISYLSHVLGDMATPSGCPLLWPSRRAFSARLWRTGAPVENCLGLVLLVGLVWLDGSAIRQSAEDGLWQAAAWSPWAVGGAARLAGLLAAD